MLPTEVLLHGVSLSEEMQQVELGDRRLTARVQTVMEALSEAPDDSYPDIFGDDSELEGFYRLIRNPALSVGQVLSPHREQTAERSRQVGQVLAIHDTSEMSWPLRDGKLRKNLCKLSSRRQGFHVHATMVVSADGLRAPLGAVGLRPYAHDNGLSDDAYAFWDREYGLYDCESARWLEAVKDADEALQGVESVVHVMDREGDFCGLLAPLQQRQDRFVVRAAQDRNVVAPDDASGEPTKLFDALRDQPVLATRTVELSPRSDANRPPAERKRFPARRQRSATLEFRAVSVELLRPKGRPELAHLPERFAVNVVEAVEVDAPDGQQPVRWVLLTSEPIDTVQQVLWVVDAYRSRWMIEEFFKAIGTGCGYNKRQLNSAQHLLIALTLTLPVAWRLLVLRHLSRQCPEAPALAVLSETELALLKEAVLKWRWSAEPTVGEATGAIAKLGGHLKSNGRPGWLVLRRGYQKLLQMHAGWEAAMKMVQVLMSQPDGMQTAKLMVQTASKARNK